MTQYFLTLLALAFISFIQNMAFTFTSRSRQSGDPSYHGKAAVLSNGIWLLNQIFLVKVIWEPVMTGAWFEVLLAGAIYVYFTTAGSVYMMRLMLGEKHLPYIGKYLVEKGARKVGAESKNKKG